VIKTLMMIVSPGYAGLVTSAQKDLGNNKLIERVLNFEGRTRRNVIMYGKKVLNTKYRMLPEYSEIHS
jgi:hypothetical protein